MWVGVKRVSGSGGNNSGSGSGSGSSSSSSIRIHLIVAVVCLSDSVMSHNASTRFHVFTAVVSEASVLQRCYFLSLCRHFKSSGRSQCLRVLNPEHEITLLLRNVGNDTMTQCNVPEKQKPRYVNN